VRFLVRGRVQGVGFRAATRRKAEGLGLAGHVQNRPDGTVDGEAEGPVEAVAAFVAWLHKGPIWARVDEALVEDLQPLGAVDAMFVVRR
jgi:acylphosphatase